MSHKTVLRITSLTVQRNTTFCLNIPHLELHGGTILCVSGPNGSGKTTLVEAISGLIQPDAGIVEVGGQTITPNLYNIRRDIGYIPDDEAWLIPELTAREYMRVLADVYREAGVTSNFIDRYASLAQQLYFTSHDIPISGLSHGNKKKVQIIAGLIHQPKLIVVDELRNGLDPLAILASEELIRTEAKRGACIVAATHDLWWAQRTADEVLILFNGNVAMHKTTSAVLQDFDSLEQAFKQIAKPHV